MSLVQPVTGTLKSRRRHFRGVSIACADGCCEAVKSLADSRYLADEAPILPVQECNRATCNCTYEHHADRRSDTVDRREAATGVSDEQRVRAGRRKTDWRPLGFQG